MGEKLTKSQAALTKLQKTGPLQTKKLQEWDEQLARFLNWQRAQLIYPNLDYTQAKLFPNQDALRSGQPTTPQLIDIFGGDQVPGPPPESPPVEQKTLPMKNLSPKKLLQSTPLLEKPSIIPDLPFKAISPRTDTDKPGRRAWNGGIY